MDLLNKIDKARKEAGSQEAEGKSSDAPKGEAIVGNKDATADNLKRGANLLEFADKGETQVSQETGESEEPKVSTKPVTGQAETKIVQDPDSWSKESALKEVLKLREENKAVRLKFQQQLDKIEQETSAKIAAIQEEARTASEAKKKLEALEAAQEDKKRSIEEKLAHREARLAEVETVYKVKLEEKEKEVAVYKTKAAQFEAEQEARKEVYRDRIKEAVARVPEELRDFAQRMVKGYEDPQEGWLALEEAHRKGMFSEKKVIVNHAVPGASDGARISKTKVEQEERERKGRMTSRDLIKSGLSKIKAGESNSAFRSK